MPVISTYLEVVMSNSQKKAPRTVNSHDCKMYFGLQSYHSHITVTSVLPGRIHNITNWENTFAGVEVAVTPNHFLANVATLRYTCLFFFGLKEHAVQHATKLIKCVWWDVFDIFSVELDRFSPLSYDIPQSNLCGFYSYVVRVLYKSLCY